MTRFRSVSFSFPSFDFPVSLFQILGLVEPLRPLPGTLEDGAFDGGVAGPTGLELEEEEETDLLTTSGMTLRCGVVEGVGSDSGIFSSSLIETVLGIMAGREYDADDARLLLGEEGLLVPICLFGYPLSSFSSISNTAASGSVITRSGCARFGEAG